MTVYYLTQRENEVVTITLNRPEKRNALNGDFVHALLEEVTHLSKDHALRALRICASGKDFCAGGDLAWMQQIACSPEDDNYKDAQMLADLLYALYYFPVPTIAVAQGKSLGGGMGVLAACDMVVASSDAVFGFPEVKRGLAPSVISPFIFSCLNERLIKYYFLTGELFSASDAQTMSFIHAVAEQEEIQKISDEWINTILHNKPQATREIKKLIFAVNHEKITEVLSQKTAEHLAQLRMTAEAQAGFKDFNDLHRQR